MCHLIFKQSFAALHFFQLTYVLQYEKDLQMSMFEVPYWTYAFKKGVPQGFLEPMAEKKHNPATVQPDVL